MKVFLKDLQLFLRLCLKGKPPAERIFQQDELNIFLSNDKIVDFSQINEKFAPKGYMCNISEEHAVFYNLQFDENTGFPKILESIKVDKKYACAVAI